MLEPERLALQDEDICMEYTDLRSMLSDVDDEVREPEEGTHADEIETSIMLYIHPEVVNLQQAQRDIDPRGRSGSLTRNPNAKQGLYFPSGVCGDPTLATRKKAKR